MYFASAILSHFNPWQLKHSWQQRKKRLPILQTSVLIWKIQYFGVAHPTLCCGPLFAIVVEITVKHLNHHICSQSAEGKEGAAFSGIAKWFLSSPGLFTCSLAAVCAGGIHNTTVRIPFCLLPGSEERLLSLDSPPLERKGKNGYVR